MTHPLRRLVIGALPVGVLAASAVTMSVTMSSPVISAGCPPGYTGAGYGCAPFCPPGRQLDILTGLCVHAPSPHPPPPPPGW